MTAGKNLRTRWRGNHDHHELERPMKKLVCAMSFALALAACGDSFSDDSGELATAKAEAAAAKAETAAMKAEMAASGAPEKAAGSTPAPEVQKAAATSTPKVQAKGNGKYRMPTADELANGVNANCEVMIGGYTYSGPCKFDSPGGASFGVARADGYPMSSQFEEIYVEADTRTDGFGRFRDGDGNWQDMGILTRANTRDACWTGDLTKVCAYGKKF